MPKRKYGPEVRAFRDMMVRETGEPMSLVVADILMERSADAEYERAAGGAYDPDPLEPIAHDAMEMGDDS